MFWPKNVHGGVFAVGMRTRDASYKIVFANLYTPTNNQNRPQTIIIVDFQSGFEVFPHLRRM